MTACLAMMKTEKKQDKGLLLKMCILEIGGVAPIYLPCFARFPALYGV